VPFNRLLSKYVTICYLYLITAGQKENHTDSAVKNVSNDPKKAILITTFFFLKVTLIIKKMGKMAGRFVQNLLWDEWNNGTRE
jgi:hypothetical protein